MVALVPSPWAIRVAVFGDRGPLVDGSAGRECTIGNATDVKLESGGSKALRNKLMALSSSKSSCRKS